jgi:hypothetical protein
VYICALIIAIPTAFWFLAAEAGYTVVLKKDAEAAHALIIGEVQAVAGSYYEDKVRREQSRLFNYYGDIQRLKKKGVPVPQQLRQLCLEQQHKTNYYRKRKRMRPLSNYCR